jgi:hypothetical protein
MPHRKIGVATGHHSCPLKAQYPEDSSIRLSVSDPAHVDVRCAAHTMAGSSDSSPFQLGAQPDAALGTVLPRERRPTLWEGKKTCTLSLLASKN